jgi:hypothetical protein
MQEFYIAAGQSLCARFAWKTTMGGRRIGLVLAVFGQPGIEAGLHGVRVLTFGGRRQFTRQPWAGRSVWAITTERRAGNLGPDLEGSHARFATLAGGDVD